MRFGCVGAIVLCLSGSGGGSAQAVAQTVTIQMPFIVELVQSGGLDASSPVVAQGLQRMDLLQQYLETRLRALGYEVTSPDDATSADSWWEISLGVFEDGGTPVAVSYACRPFLGGGFLRLPPLYMHQVTGRDLEIVARDIGERFAQWQRQLQPHLESSIPECRG